MKHRARIEPAWFQTTTLPYPVDLRDNVLPGLVQPTMVWPWSDGSKWPQMPMATAQIQTAAISSANRRGLNAEEKNAAPTASSLRRRQPVVTTRSQPQLFLKFEPDWRK